MESAGYGTGFIIPRTVSRPVVEFSYWLVQHCEDVWTALDVSRPDSGRDQQQPQPKRSRASAPVARQTDGQPDVVEPHQNIQDFLAALGRSPLPNKKCQDFLLSDHAFESWRSFLQQHASSESIVAMVRAAFLTVLSAKCQWVWYTKPELRLEFDRRMEEACSAAPPLSVPAATWMALSIMHCLNLGQLRRTIAVPGGGRPVVYFRKQQFQIASMPPHVRTAFALLGVHTSSTPSLAAVLACAAAAEDAPERANVTALPSVPDDFRKDVRVSELGLRVSTALAGASQGAVPVSRATTQPALSGGGAAHDAQDARPICDNITARVASDGDVEGAAVNAGNAAARSEVGDVSHASLLSASGGGAIQPAFPSLFSAPVLALSEVPIDHGVQAMAAHGGFGH